MFWKLIKDLLVCRRHKEKRNVRLDPSPVVTFSSDLFENKNLMITFMSDLFSCLKEPFYTFLRWKKSNCVRITFMGWDCDTRTPFGASFGIFWFFCFPVMNNCRMPIKQVFLAVVISCLLTTVISESSITEETCEAVSNLFELIFQYSDNFQKAQCVPITAPIVKIEYFVMLITRQFLLVWTIYHINRAVAPYLGGLRGQL